nr:putative ribonuclease H-like domain-containing protein [Tanacetum cinerariifolium]
MDLEFPEKVYKVEKALYGLHQAPRAWYETLSTYLLDNGFHRGHIDKTLFIKRLKGDILLVQVYVDDIIFGSTKKSLCDELEQIMHNRFQMILMGELTFFLGLQVKQKEDGIFINQDNDYASASLDKKSTTGGCQFLISRLISWQCKKQTVVANSTTEAEYIAASHCCRQVLWIQNQMMDYGYNFMQTKIHVDNKSAICVIKNPIYHFKTKHIELMHHFIRDSYEKRLIEMVKIHTDNNVADLLTKAFDHHHREPSTPASSPSRITSSTSLSPQHTPIDDSPNIQTTTVAEETTSMPHDSPLQSVHSLGHAEDPSKHGKRLIEELDMDVDISLVPPHGADQEKSDDTQVSGQPEEQLGVFSAANVLADTAKQGRGDENVQTYTRQRRRVNTANTLVSTADVSAASEMISIVDLKARDKGKAVMQESEPTKKIKKRTQVQMSIDEELARKLREEELARFNAEQEGIDKVGQEKVVAKGGFKLSHFKGMSFEDIRPIFKKIWDQIHSFVPMNSELEAQRSRRTCQEVKRQSTEEEKGKNSDDSSKQTGKKILARKRAGGHDSEESVKKQKLEDDTEKKELKAYLDIVPKDEFVMEVESLATKNSIIDWKTHVLTEHFMYYQIIKADGSFKNYKIFSEMLDDFDRQDVMDLHILVEERYTTTSPEGYDLMLWGDLKTLFEHDKENELWKNQHEYNLISWRLCNLSGIHILLLELMCFSYFLSLLSDTTRKCDVGSQIHCTLSNDYMHELMSLIGTDTHCPKILIIQFGTVFKIDGIVKARHLKAATRLFLNEDVLENHVYIK